MSNIKQNLLNKLFEKVLNDAVEVGHDVLEYGRVTALQARGITPKPNQHTDFALNPNANNRSSDNSNRQTSQNSDQKQDQSTPANTDGQDQGKTI